MAYAPQERRTSRPFGLFRAVFALILREMGSTHGRALGGYVWKMAEPVLGLALFSFVASLAFRSPSIGNSFPIYFAAGFLPYLTFNDVQKRTASAIMYSKQLLTYPSVTIVDAILARVILAAATQVVIFYIIVTTLEFVTTTQTSYRLERVIGGMTMAIVLGMCIGTFNCFFWHYFPMWRRIWKILTRPLMILSGVLFILEDVPSTYQSVIWWNPLIHITGYTRSGFFISYNPEWVSFMYVYLFALIPCVVGLFLLYHFHRRILHQA